MSSKSKYLTCAEMAEQLRMSEFTARKWARLGKIPARKMGHDWQFDPARVEHALDRTRGNAFTQAEARAL